jgi:hypothetical protein
MSYGALYTNLPILSSRQKVVEFAAGELMRIRDPGGTRSSPKHCVQCDELLKFVSIFIADWGNIQLTIHDHRGRVCLFDMHYQTAKQWPRSSGMFSIRVLHG